MQNAPDADFPRTERIFTFRSFRHIRETEFRRTSDKSENRHRKSALQTRSRGYKPHKQPILLSQNRNRAFSDPNIPNPDTVRTVWGAAHSHECGMSAQKRSAALFSRNFRRSPFRRLSTCLRFRIALSRRQA